MEEVTKVKLLSEGTRFMHNDISLVNLKFFPCLQKTLVSLGILKTIWEGKKERESDLAAVFMQSRSHYFLNKVEFYSS